MLTTMKFLATGIALGVLAACGGSEKDSRAVSPGGAVPAKSDAPRSIAEPPKKISLAADATSVPADFVGDDIQQVYNSLANAGKSEFETTGGSQPPHRRSSSYCV